MGRDQGVDRMKNYVIHRDEEMKIFRVTSYESERVTKEKLIELLNKPENKNHYLIENEELFEIMEYLDEQEELTKDFKSLVKDEFLSEIKIAISELETIERDLSNFGEEDSR